MRILLTNSNEFLIGSDIEVCVDLADVYNVIDKNQEDEVCYIYVDLPFCSLSVFKQLEMFSYEFSEFRIVIDETASTTLSLNPTLKTNLYSLTPITNVANDLFLKAEDYVESSVLEGLGELKEALTDQNLVKELVEHDYIKFRKTLTCLLQTVEQLNHNNNRLQENLVKHIEEKLDSIRNLRLMRKRLNEVEQNREELLKSNLNLKFPYYLNVLDFQPVETETRIAYVKCMLSNEEEAIVTAFKSLHNLIRRKYNVNSCLVIIDDPNALKLKKVRSEFTYVINDGTYTMNMGDKIITTPTYPKGLFDNFDKFSGVKDLFIVLDFTPSSRTYVVSNGAYVLVRNDRLE